MDFSGALSKIDASHSWSAVSNCFWSFISSSLLTARHQLLRLFSLLSQHPVWWGRHSPRSLCRQWLSRDLFQAVAVRGISTLTHSHLSPGFLLKLSSTWVSPSPPRQHHSYCSSKMPGRHPWFFSFVHTHIQSIRTSVMSFFRIFLKGGHSYKIFVPCPRS